MTLTCSRITVTPVLPHHLQPETTATSTVLNILMKETFYLFIGTLNVVGGPQDKLVPVLTYILLYCCSYKESFSHHLLRLKMFHRETAKPSTLTTFL